MIVPMTLEEAKEYLTTTTRLGGVTDREKYLQAMKIVIGAALRPR